MPIVTETLEQSIERMTDKVDALKAEVVTLTADVEEHYTALGRIYYNERRLARAADHKRQAAQ